MKTVVQTQNGIRYALVSGDETLITDRQSALDLLMTVQNQTGCDRIAIRREQMTEAFFSLRTGLAGEILQKFVNYRVKLAIIGDFSGYSSQPLQDFMWESNHGRAIFFVATEQEAAKRLTESVD